MLSRPFRAEKGGRCNYYRCSDRQVIRGQLCRYLNHKLMHDGCAVAARIVFDMQADRAFRARQCKRERSREQDDAMNTPELIATCDECGRTEHFIDLDAARRSDWYLRTPGGDWCPDCVTDEIVEWRREHRAHVGDLTSRASRGDEAALAELGEMYPALTFTFPKRQS